MVVVESAASVKGNGTQSHEFEYQSGNLLSWSHDNSPTASYSSRTIIYDKWYKVHTDKPIRPQPRNIVMS